MGEKGRATNCSEVADFCWMMNMTMVRALCPSSCKCHEPYPKYTGFFLSEMTGCPAACITFLRTKVSLPKYICNDTLEGFADSNADIWTRYVEGMRAYVLSLDGFLDHLDNA